MIKDNFQKPFHSCAVVSRYQFDEGEISKMINNDEKKSLMHRRDNEFDFVKINTETEKSFSALINKNNQTNPTHEKPSSSPPRNITLSIKTIK